MQKIAYNAGDQGSIPDQRIKIPQPCSVAKKYFLNRTSKVLSCSSHDLCCLPLCMLFPCLECPSFLGCLAKSCSSIKANLVGTSSLFSVQDAPRHKEWLLFIQLHYNVVDGEQGT